MEIVEGRPGPRARTRRDAVLDDALGVFARYGYRKASMEDVAAEARISRPGLYFLFSSKMALFQAAIERAIELDLDAAERALGERDRPVAARVLDAFDSWAARYIGPMSDAQTLIDANPGLLGPSALGGPSRFRDLLRDALRDAHPDPSSVTDTLISVSIGLKHQVADRAEYLTRLRTAIGLMDLQEAIHELP